jgi:hypothetical protein
MTMLAQRLMRLIENHSETLAETLEQRIATSDRCVDYRNVSGEELKKLVGGIYGQLGQWLVTKTEADIESRYAMVGSRRAEQDVPVSQLLWCIVLVKENLWDFMRSQSMENTQWVFGELELMQLVEQFFDRAIYYAVRGHEQVLEGRAAGKQ